jgi:hypothetical protein
LISIALLIYVLIRKKSVTGVTGITYISQNNTTAKCPYPLGLSTSDGNEDAVKATCDIDPSCVGYYKSSNWSIATKIDPSKCDEKGVSGYTTFYKKNPPPPPPKVGTYTEISNSVTSKKAHACFNSVYENTEDVQRVLCDNDDDCKGYYFNPTTGGGIVYTSDKTQKECMKPDIQIDGYNVFKPKDDNYKSYSNSQKKAGSMCIKNFYAGRLTSKQGAEDVIKKICNELPTCKGYYKNKNAFIASKKLPSEIDSGDEDSDYSGGCFSGDEDSDYETEYPYFMKKEV